METTNSMRVCKIDSFPDCLREIKALWREHADTLGFFPEGAFDTYANKQQILIAVDTSDNFLGYLLYRVTPSRNDASIVHLCVNQNARDQGVASLLVKELINTTKSLRGVGLKCRRDFDANKLWPRFGFVAVSESLGRSKTGSTLTRWWYDHKHPDLFSIAQESQQDSTRRVVIDANVFFDLKNQSNHETMALTADWLDDSISIWITDELLNEINRASTLTEREAARAYATQFHMIQCDAEEFDRAFNALKRHFPLNPSDQDRSDFTHLAKAIAVEADFYVTRDDAVLDKSNAVYEEFGIPILRPSDLVTEIDALYRESEYQPARLSGTLYGIARIKSKSESRIVEQFQNHADGERQSVLKDKLRMLLSSPRNIECYEALDHDGNSIGMVVYNTQSHGILKVELLRVIKKHSLTKTIIRYLIGQLIRRSSVDQCHLIHIADQFIDSETREALIEDYFQKIVDGWYKLSVTEHLTSEALTDKLNDISKRHPSLEQYCSSISSLVIDANTMKDVDGFERVEAIISPGLVKNSLTPCFIVPIQPSWAQHLFDERLAEQDLFGAKIDLALNREAVYYRSAINAFGLSSPARIIWYVSKDERYAGSGSLRAYSRVDEVILDYPKPLFRQFRRLGIYEWEDVLYTAKKIDNQLMAIRFSNTAMLAKPLKWDKLKTVLLEAGIKTQLQSPCPISESLFFTLIS